MYSRRVNYEFCLAMSVAMDEGSLARGRLATNIHKNNFSTTDYYIFVPFLSASTIERICLMKN